MRLALSFVQKTKIHPFVFITLFFVAYLSFFMRTKGLLQEGTHIDLPSFYWASVTTFHHNLSPYNPETLIETAERYSFTSTIFPFFYPPPSLLFFLPFSFVSYDQAQNMMLLVNHGIVLFLLFFIPFKLFPNIRKGPQLLLLFVGLYLLNFQPLILTMEHGQINLVVMLLLCLVLFGLQQRLHPLFTAFMLCCAICLKSYPLIFIPFLFIKKEYAVLAWSAGVCLIVLGISFFIFPHTLWSEWIEFAYPSAQYGAEIKGLFSQAAPWNQSINGFTARIFLESRFSQALISNIVAAKIIPFVSAIVVLLITFFTIIKSTKAKRLKLLSMEFSLVLLVMYLVAPIAWDHHLVFILPAILFAIATCFTSNIMNRAMEMVLFCTAMILALSLPLNSAHLKNSFFTLFISTKLFAVLGLWILFLFKVYRSISIEKMTISASNETVLEK